MYEWEEKSRHHDVVIYILCNVYSLKSLTESTKDESSLKHGFHDVSWDDNNNIKLPHKWIEGGLTPIGILVPYSWSEVESGQNTDL